MKNLSTIAIFAASILITAPALGGEFLAPAWWGLGDTGTTYQQWDFLTAGTGNVPDIGRMTDGTTLPDPTLSVTPPAFVTGSGNFYSFSGPYSVETDIPNYGSGAGTHVIVQTSASMNPDPNAGGPASVYLDSLRIEDGAGSVLPGGANADALQESLVTTTISSGPSGDVTVEWLIWEFYLPGHAGDFQIVSDSIIHSSFYEARVDTAIASVAYPITPIPEPATMLMVGMTTLLLRRRR